MDMDKLVSLCKRRGFLFQSSEIYGGLNGFWDYGPLGVELKRNIKEAWWHDMVTGHDDLATPAGAPEAVRNDRPRLHDHHAPAGLEVLGALRPVLRLHGRLPARSKKRYRHDQVRGRWVEAKGSGSSSPRMLDGEEGAAETEQRALKFFNLRGEGRRASSTGKARSFR